MTTTCYRRNILSSLPRVSSVWQCGSGGQRIPACIVPKSRVLLSALGISYLPTSILQMLQDATLGLVQDLYACFLSVTMLLAAINASPCSPITDAFLRSPCKLLYSLTHTEPDSRGSIIIPLIFTSSRFWAVKRRERLCHPLRLQPRLNKHTAIQGEQCKCQAEPFSPSSFVNSSVLHSSG